MRLHFSPKCFGSTSPLSASEPRLRFRVLRTKVHNSGGGSSYPAVPTARPALLSSTRSVPVRVAYGPVHKHPGACGDRPPVSASWRTGSPCDLPAPRDPIRFRCLPHCGAELHRRLDTPSPRADHGRQCRDLRTHPASRRMPIPRSASRPGARRHLSRPMAYCQRKVSTQHADRADGRDRPRGQNDGSGLRAIGGGGVQTSRIRR